MANFSRSHARNKVANLAVTCDDMRKMMTKMKKDIETLQQENLELKRRVADLEAQQCHYVLGHPVLGNL